MTLRGEIDSFPLETVIQLIHSTNKTGQLEIRGADSTGGTLGFDGGRLIAAIAGEDVGEPALGAVFALGAGSFEFIPWNDAPTANLSGDLDQLLDRAFEERDRFVAIRKVIPDDRSRFRLSERAADKGEITLSPDQWRTLLAVNGDRDVKGVADHLKAGRLATRGSLAGLVEAGFIDVVEPPAEAPPAPAPTSAQQLSPPVSEARTWAPPPPEPAPPAVEPAPVTPATAWEPAAPAETWEPTSSAQSWESPAPATPSPQTWESPEPPRRWDTSASTDIRADLAAALDARLGVPPSAEPETAPEPSPADIPLAADERLAALSGVFAPTQPVVPEEPPAQDRINEWARPAPFAQTQAPAEEKKKGLFGFLKREERAGDEATATAEPTAALGRAGQLASLANALLAEYNSGRYGNARLDDRMANLLMRVDEQADPIDRPLPIVDDSIDAQALDRENMPEQQAVPYLALLVSQIYEDAERTFGKDKAKKGYRAAQQQVFGSDTAALAAPDVAGRLPKV